MEQPAAVVRQSCVLFLLVACVRSADDRCQINQLPQNGVAFAGSLKLLTGQYVDEFTLIAYKCIENHHIVGQSSNFCNQGQWLNAVPECRAFCDPAEVNGVTTTANCKLADKLVSCPKLIPVGTIASMACKHGYKRSRRTPSEVTCGPNGRWLPGPLPCQQICGEVYSEARPLIVGGRKINVTETPWHAGIYKKDDRVFEQVCGGTIVNARVVVSAMHCFWNAQTRSAFDSADYSIAVGKTRRDYLASEDVGLQQNLQIESLHYVEGYSHEETNYAEDIVVIVLRQAIEFKPHVSPVCISYALRYDDRTVASGLPMKVAGWGLEAAHGESSDHLKVIELSSISRRDCASNFAEKQISFVVTSDKFCAEFRGGDQNVCGGDSGGGLVQSDPGAGNQNATIYFLRGIVSTAISSEGSCDVSQYSQFTNVAFYLELVGNYDRLHRPENNLQPSNKTSNKSNAGRINPNEHGSSEDCVLNEIPSKGRVEEAFNSSRQLTRGAIISPLTVLRFKCDENYLLIGNELNYCFEGQLAPGTPDCELIDPGRCRIETAIGDGWIEDFGSSRRFAEGAFVEEFTLVRYKCTSGFPPIGEESNLCFKGKWQRKAAECEASCDTSGVRGISITSTCEVNGAQVPCSGHVKSGTKAVITCQKGYERSEGHTQISHCEVNSGWWPRPQACTPICGILNSDQEFHFGRNPLHSYSAVTWRVGIYLQIINDPVAGEFWYECTGTILNARFITTAVHCLTHGGGDEVLEPSLLRVVAGELRNSFLLEGAYSGDANQTVGVQEILNPGYQALPFIRNHDFALVILDKRIIFGENVAPICIELGAKDFAPNGQRGFYFGYQKFPDGAIQDSLDALVVPILDRVECGKRVNGTFERNVTPETFCTGPVNDTDVGYCEENGSGLAVPKQVGGRTKYFLHGVYSIINSGTCSPNAYTAVASAHHFQDFLLQALGYQSL